MIAEKLHHLMSRVNEPWYSWLVAVANARALVRNPEKPVDLGALNPERTLYVVNDLRKGVGLAGWVERVIGYILFARRRGWTPVVMMPSDEPREDLGWYEYFNGVSAIDPSEVMNSRHVVFATTRHSTYARYNKSV